MATKRSVKHKLLPLGREMVSQIVAAGNSDGATDGLNIVDMLEVLIDAGQFVEAERLAQRAVEMVAADGRERLFLGYLALCELMRRGNQSEALETLERLYVAINHAGHSTPDKVRIALLVSRAFAVCVGLGTANQGVLLRARNLLSVELSRLADSDNIDLRCQVVLELAKCYLHAPTSDARAALLLVESFTKSVRLEKLTAWRAFDLRRVAFQAKVILGEVDDSVANDDQIDVDGGDSVFSVARLRQTAKLIGGLAPGLAELAIARGNPEQASEQLDFAAEVFNSYHFLSGHFEVLFLRASMALDRGLNTLADRYLRQAVEVAERGGFEHGALLARIGLFQAAMIGDNRQEARGLCDQLARELSSELALGSAGLNVAAAQQMVGDIEGALKTAQRCERFFKDNELPGFESQAAAIVGTCKAHQGSWREARLAWARCVSIDSSRGAFLQSAEKRCLVAQAILMQGAESSDTPTEATFEKVREVLGLAERDIEPFFSASEAERIRAKIEAVHALVCVQAGHHTGALKHLSRAREISERLGLVFEVALNEALMGLSMLEVGKVSSAELCEEAVLHLQKALNFFSSSDLAPIKWKLFYYLALAAVMIDQKKSLPHEKMRWRNLAVSWIAGADRELQRISNATGRVSTEGGEIDFSPGLKPEALGSLKESLGIDRVARPKRKAKGEAKIVIPANEQLH